MNIRCKMGELDCGDRGTIVSLEGDPGICRRLMEMGLIEGSEVELMHEAPFGGDPIAVRVRGALIAIRRAEANYITVQTGTKNWSVS